MGVVHIQILCIFSVVKRHCPGKLNVMSCLSSSFEGAHFSQKASDPISRLQNFVQVSLQWLPPRPAISICLFIHKMTQDQRDKCWQWKTDALKERAREREGGRERTKKEREHRSFVCFISLYEPPGLRENRGTNRVTVRQAGFENSEVEVSRCNERLAYKQTLKANNFIFWGRTVLWNSFLLCILSGNVEAKNFKNWFWWELSVGSFSRESPHTFVFLVWHWTDYGNIQECSAIYDIIVNEHSQPGTVEWGFVRIRHIVYVNGPIARYSGAILDGYRYRLTCATSTRS